MSTFGSLLVQDRVVDVTQIERALQHQVIYGGDLATNLLELGLVDEIVIAAYAARALDLPGLAPDLVETAAPEAIKLVPWETVNTHRILPVGIDGDQMMVAVSQQLSDRAFEDLSFLLNVEFVPHFILDFRLAMGLHRYYGIPISPRLRALQQRLAPHFELETAPLVPPPERDAGLFTGVDPRPKSEEPEAAVPAPEDEDEASVEAAEAVIESNSERGRQTDATLRIFTSPHKHEDGGRAEELPSFIPLTSPPVQPASKPKSEPEKEAAEKEQPTSPKAWPAADESPVYKATSQAPLPVPFDTNAAQKRLESAGDRDSILDFIMDYAAQIFEFAILLVVQGNNAQGRSAVLGSRESRRVDLVSIPLDQGGMFQTVFETRAFHLGPLGTSETEAETLAKMERKWPQNCAILPVTLRHRVILMVYGDSGKEAVQAEHVAEFSRLMRHVGDAFERLLLAQKYGSSEKAPSFVPQQPSSEPPPEPAPATRKGLVDWAGRYHIKGDEEESRPEMVEKLPGVSRRPSSIPPPPAQPKSQDTSVRWAAESAGSYSTSAASEDLGASTFHEKRPGKEEEVFQTPVEEPLALTESNELERETRDYQQFPLMARDTGPSIVDAEPPRSSHPPAVLSSSVVSITNGYTPPDALATGKKPTAAAAEKKSRIPVVGQGTGVTASAVVTIKPDRPSRSVMVDMKEEVARLVERILSPGRFDEPAADLLVGIGDDAIAKLIKHFPGPLVFDRYQDAARLPRVGQHGPLLRALLMFNEKAVSFLLPLFESRDSDVRFYATFLFSELQYPKALGALTTRLFDNDRQIRALAIDVLRAFQKYPEYRWAMREVLSVLTGAGSSLDAKRIAAEALGELREASSVGVLAQMLASVDAVLVERCHRALVKITFADFGFSGQRWLDWWAGNHERHRIEWAIDSVVHPKEPIRLMAIREIRGIVGHAVEWTQGPMDHKQRQDVQKRTREWWNREGRALFPRPGGDFGE